MAPRELIFVNSCRPDSFATRRMQNFPEEVATHQSPKAPAASSTVHVPHVSIAGISGVVKEAQISVFSFLYPDLCPESGFLLGGLPSQGQARGQDRDVAREGTVGRFFRETIARVCVVEDREETWQRKTGLWSGFRPRSAVADMVLSLSTLTSVSSPNQSLQRLPSIDPCELAGT